MTQSHWADGETPNSSPYWRYTHHCRAVKSLKNLNNHLHIKLAGSPPEIGPADDLALRGQWWMLQ